MRKSLVVALYAENEGVTEHRFLPAIIRRTSEDILLERGLGQIDILEPFVIKLNPNPTNQRDRIVQAARQAVGYHALVVHVDADGPSAAKALSQRYQPGVDSVSVAPPPICRDILPIVPIRMTEAWMLADPNALTKEIGTTMDARNLGLPLHPQAVEAVTDPKQTLKQAIETATHINTRRRRRIDFESIHSPLSNSINLQLLRSVPSCQQFVEDLTTLLIGLSFAR